MQISSLCGSSRRTVRGCSVTASRGRRRLRLPRSSCSTRASFSQPRFGRIRAGRADTPVLSLEPARMPCPRFKPARCSSCWTAPSVARQRQAPRTRAGCGRGGRRCRRGEGAAPFAACSVGSAVGASSLPCCCSIRPPLSVLPRRPAGADLRRRVSWRPPRCWTRLRSLSPRVVRLAAEPAALVVRAEEVLATGGAIAAEAEISSASAVAATICANR